MNTNEILGELSCENGDISTCDNNMSSSHMKRSPLLWLNLLNITPSAAKTIITIIWNGWVLHWCYKKTIEHEMATWMYKIISLLELKNISKAVLYTKFKKREPGALNLGN